MSVDRLQELDGFTVVLLASLVPSSSVSFPAGMGYEPTTSLGHSKVKTAETRVGRRFIHNPFYNPAGKTQLNRAIYTLLASRLG